MNFCWGLAGKYYIRGISLITLLMTLGVSSSRACGPVFYEFEEYSFLDAGIIDLGETLGPWLLESNSLFEKYKRIPAEDKKQSNLAEWQERYCFQATIEDIEQIVYSSTLSVMESIDMAVRSEAIPLPYGFEKNTFASYLADEKCEETSAYLVYAKRCEPHVAPSQNLWSRKEPNIEAMNVLMKVGVEQFLACKSHYLKRRYAYQVMRLAHYSGQYEEVLKWYDWMIPKIDRRKPSIIDGWILSLRAGALRRVGEGVEAAYLFSLIFADYPSIRTEAFRSFYLKNEKEWDACLYRCESNRQRATLHVIRANASHSKRVEEMEAIYALEPAHLDLPVILVQELLDLEKEVLKKSNGWNKGESTKKIGAPSSKVFERIIKLQIFIKKVLKDALINDTEIWQVAAGYLHVLNGDYYNAGLFFSRIKESMGDVALREQVITLELVMKILQLGEKVEEMEQYAYQLRFQTPIFKSRQDFAPFLRDKMGEVYLREGNPGKAFLTIYGEESLRYNPSIELIEELLQISEQEEKSSYERRLLQRKTGGELSHYLWYLKGLYHLGRFQLEAAAMAFKQIPATERATYGTFDPFQFNLSECISCVEQARKFNVLEIVEEMRSLEYEAKASPSKAAANYFKIGLGMYNMTYYGYCWMAADQYRGGENWGMAEDNIYPLWFSPNGNYEVKDCSRPLYYFELSRQFADKTDRELAAKAAFMAARCRQKQYYNSGLYRITPRNDKIPVMPAIYNDYYELLVTSYGETKFYGEMSKECLYFKAYSMR